MIVYIASKFSSRTRLRPWRQKLIQSGQHVLSHWMIDDPDPSSEHDSLGDNLEQSQHMARRDQDEVSQCDMFILDTIDPSQTGGREVELGFVMGVGGVTTIRVGPIRNVFHSIVDYSFNDWETFYQWFLLKYGEKS